MKLNEIFKAYDIRGVYPSEIDADTARRIGAAFAIFADSPTILVGRDMRTSSPELAAAFLEGVTSQGVDGIDLGEVSTDLVYFAAGTQKLPGAMFTASHNPAKYNGIKLCLAGAAPVGADTGLSDIKDLTANPPLPEGKRGTVRQLDLLSDFADHLLAQVDVNAIKPLTVVVDAANGMGGKVVPAVLGRLPITLIPLYFELDGTFPNHPADPIQPENLVELQRVVLERNADLGIAFDGDADRCFLVDSDAKPVSGSLTTALVAKRILASNPGGTVIYNAICSRTVPEVVAECGGKAVRSKVGHSYIKGIMAETDAVFGGEHSGHYYFRDNFRADSGLLTALYVLETMSDTGQSLAELVAPLDRYSASGEINTEVGDQADTMARVEAQFSDQSTDHLDGLTVSSHDWWFNLRPSNTEPLLRLNVEATDADVMAHVRDRVLSILRKGT